MSVVYFLLLLGVLVVFHELGHFIAAKALGFKVLRFSVGFGRPLLRVRGRETEYQLAIIPLGGKIYPYVVTPEELEPAIGVPIVNTKAVGVSYAELMVRSRISHSIKAYPYTAGLNPDDVSQRGK